MFFFKGFGCCSVSRHFWIQKVSRNRKMTKSVVGAKPSRTGGHRRTWKVSGNRKMTKSFVKQNCYAQGGTKRPFRCLDRPWPAGLDGIVVRIHLHTPRFAPAALSSVEVSGNRGNNKIPWKNDYCQGILSFLLFLDIFWIQKCLETGKTTKFLKNNVFFSRDLVVFLFLDTFEPRKCL